MPMTHPTKSATGRAVLYAIVGFVVVLVLGAWVSRSVGGDSFGDLALAAATATILAPLGALAGAVLATRRYRRIELTPADRALFGWVMIAAWALTVGAYLLSDAISALTVLILETTALVIARIALAEGTVKRGGSRRRPRRLRLRFRH